MFKLFCLVSLVFIPWIGPEIDDELRQKIFFEIRIPRVLVGVFVGALLGLSGFLYQLVFRNPLATPYTLGVASGASLGAVAAIAMLPALPPEVGGIVGAFLVVALFFGFFRGQYLVDRIVLLGVVLSLFLSSLTVVFQYVATGPELFRIVHWLLGSLQVTSIFVIGVTFGLLVLLLVFSILFKTELSMIAVGDEFAKSKGVEADRINWIFFVISSVVIGVSVSFFGPIGFVGLAVPFLVRAIEPYDLKEQIFLSAILGAVFLAWSDALGRLIAYPLEVPAGVITAILGAPIVGFSIFKR